LIVIDCEVLEEENNEDSNSCIEDIEDGSFRGIDIGTIDVIDDGKDEGSKDHFTLLVSGEHFYDMVTSSIYRIDDFYG
jgi:hypothetical protein